MKHICQVFFFVVLLVAMPASMNAQIKRTTKSKTTIVNKPKKPAQKKWQFQGKVKEATNAEEAGQAIAAELNDVVTVLPDCESKEDLKELVQAIADDMKYLSEAYPDYQPDAETEKAIVNAAVVVGEAIGTVAVALGMDDSDIAELQDMLTQ